jgi:archaellin
MSHYAHRVQQFRLHGVKRLIVLLAVLVAFAAAAIVLAQTGGSTTKAGSSVGTPSGPDETTRGVSAAQAAGASDAQPAGGPDEARRGRVYQQSTSGR